MPGDIKITKADMSHASMLVQLSITTFCDTFGAVNKREDMDKYILEELNEGKLTEELKDGNNFFLLVWHDEEIAGFAKLRRHNEPKELNNNKPIEIERLYVLREHHGKKIGAALMNHIIQYASDTGHDVIWLGVWEHNHGAILFYKQWGFETFGAHPFILGNDKQNDVLMKKPLIGPR